MNIRCDAELAVAYPDQELSIREGGVITRWGDHGGGHGGGMAARMAFRALARYAIAAIGLAALSCGLPLAAMAQTCVPSSTVDWMVTGNPMAQDVRPRDCDTVQQSPPAFRWPDVIKSGGYQVTLTYPDGRARTLAATQNWLNWDEVLAAGNYSWSVTYSGGTASMRRRFTVDSNSKPFLVPKMSAVLTTVSAKPHPRSLPDAATLAAMKSQRSSAVSSLLNEVSGHLTQVLPTAGASADDAFTYSKLALSSLMACVYSNQDVYCNDAIRRVMSLASWDPVGATSYTKAGMNMAARNLTWTVAIGYDWLYPRLTTIQRSQLLSMINTRNAAMYNDIIGSRARIAISPRDSLGNQTLSAVAVISTLVAGDLPVAGTWLQNALPLALNSINPWGGDDGGFANAAAQGAWDVSELAPAWNALFYATGINVAQNAWVRNWGRYFTYFTPPGMAAGTTVFGDGFELNESEHQASYGKGYFYFNPTPLGRWHAAQLNAENPTRFEYLMAPPADFSGAQAFPSGTPNSLYLSSIGQVAMHSDLSAPGRTSVYFKSSPPPYGAYNHSHADQNSFVVNSGGQRLAIESGYYDNYKTSHWLNWYHTTKAKNAITYDGGQGQLFYEVGDKMGYGRITGFTSTPAYDVVSGDATAAYGGALTTAQRMLVYLRPNLILVYDNVASATSRQWEWNIHAVNQMTSTSDTTAKIQNNGQTMCITMLAGPTMRFSQTNQFTANPTGTWAAQWHGKFYSTTRVPSTEFIALLNVGCTSVMASATKSGGVWTVPVGATVVTIDSGGIAVSKPASSTPPPPPPPATSSRPYTGTPIAIPGMFEAENFDLGGEGIAYHDLAKGNAGGQYRTTEDVDIVASTDSLGGAYVINNFQTGEWLNYTINVATSGNYSVQLRGANGYNAGVAFHVEVDGVRVTPSLLFPLTGGWTTYQWVATPAFALAAGTHVLKIVSDQQYFNLNSVNVVAASSPTPVPVPTPVPTPVPAPTPVPIPTAGVSWSCDFENEYCGFLEQSKLGDAPPSARRSSLVAPSRSGKLAVRLHTEPGDNNVHGSGTWERDDLSYGPSSAYCNQGQEEWWAHSVLFPDDYVFPPVGGAAGIIFDFHHNASSGQSNFEVQTIPGVGLRLEGHGGATIDGGRYDFVIADPYGAPAGSVKKNVWYDFVYHVKWNSTSSGLMEAWLNGKKVMTYNGPTLYTGISCYLKLANYHGPFGLPSSVIHDRVIRGNSAAAVAITPLSP